MFKINNTYINYKVWLFGIDTSVIFLSFYFSLLLNRYNIGENYGYLIPIYLISLILFVYFDSYKYKSLKLISGYITRNILINIIILGLITLAVFVFSLGDVKVFLRIFMFYVLFYFTGIVLFKIILFSNVFKNLNKISRFNRNAVILGINEDSENLYKNKADIRINNGLNIIGFIKTKGEHPDFKFKELILGEIGNIFDLSEEFNFKDVFLLNNDFRTNEIINIIESLRANNFMVRADDKNLSCLIGANLYDIYGYGYKFIDFSLDRPYYKNTLKVFLDYLFGIILLAVCFPAIMLIAILIKISSKGPAFFIGERIGYKENIFKIFKFRSMYNDPANNLKAHKENIKAFYIGSHNGKVKKRNAGSKVTPIGRFLRKHSIDEIPQFFNIILKDMSIIGPRPCMDYEMEYFDGWKKNRFKIKPGITGLWQVYGRSKVDFDGLSVMDYFYYTNCSFTLDLKIAFDTFKVIIMGIGGY